MAWCGNDAVALYFCGHALLLVGPNGESLEFLSERTETLCLGQEVRGGGGSSSSGADAMAGGGSLTASRLFCRWTRCAWSRRTSASSSTACRARQWTRWASAALRPRRGC